nr:hypothetical protein [Myxococcales bacterium]
MLVFLFSLVAFGQSATKSAQRELQWSCDDANAQACLALGRIAHARPSPSDDDVAETDQLLRRACLGGAAEGCLLQAQRREARLWSESELGRWLVVNAYRVACNTGESTACARTAELMAQLAYKGPPLFGAASEETKWKHDANRVLQALSPTLWGRCVDED